MKIYHRIVGDTPQRGYDVSIVSPGFPQTTKLGNINKARLPISEVPYEKKGTQGATQLVEQHRAYEVQPMSYGNLAVIHSAVGCMGAARVHCFSDIALPWIGEGVLTDTLTAEQLLTLDDFMSIQSFWNIENSVNVLPIDDWTPPESIGFTWNKPMPLGLREALLAQYWRAATQSIFGGKLEPVRVCLSDETDCIQIIEQAKAFFACVIATGLPRATQNIMSMSAPVPQRVFLQVFFGSALVFLYPEEKLSCEFDLRSGAFRPSSADEVAMITHLMHGGQIALLNDMFARYRAAQGNTVAEHCPFMADFDIALIAYRLENNLVNPTELPRLWRLLSDYLAQRHGLGSDLAQMMLIGTDSTIVKQLCEQQPLPAFAPEEARLLFVKALSAEGPLLDAEIDLLARHQAERQQPFIADLLLGYHQTDVHRTATILRSVLERAYVGNPLDQYQRDRLASDAFAKRFMPYDEVRAVMAEYIRQAGKRHAENTLFMLPLAIQYLNAQELLTQTLALLRNAYVDTLPDQAMCMDIHASWQHSTAEHMMLLEEYYGECINRHIDSLETLGIVVGSIGVDIGHTLCLFYDNASINDAYLDTPLTARKLDGIKKCLHSPVANPATVYTHLLIYVDAVLARSLQAGVNRFDWLAELRASGIIQTDDVFEQCAIGYILEYGITHQSIPHNAAFQALLGWQQSGRLQQVPDAEDKLKCLYDQYGDIGKKQLLALIPYLHNTKGYLYLGQVHAEYIRSKLNALADKCNYWDAVDSVREDLAAAGLDAGAALQGEVKEKLASSLDRLFCSRENVSEFLWFHNKGSQSPNDAFLQLWNERLGSAFQTQFDILLQNAFKQDVDAISHISNATLKNNGNQEPGKRKGNPREGGQRQDGLSEQNASGVAYTRIGANDQQPYTTSAYKQFKELQRLLVAYQRPSIGSLSAGWVNPLRNSGEQTTPGDTLIPTLDGVIRRLTEELPKRSGDALVSDAKDIVRDLLRCANYRTYLAMRTYLSQLMLVEPRHRERLRSLNFERKLAVAVVCCSQDNSEQFMEQLLETIDEWPEEALKAPFSHPKQLAAIGALFQRLGDYSPTYPEQLCEYLRTSKKWAGYAANIRADRKHTRECYPWLTQADAYDQYQVPKAMQVWLSHTNRND